MTPTWNDIKEFDKPEEHRWLLYLYGYNGSGVGMRCPAWVVTVDDDTAVVTFGEFEPPFDSMTEQRVSLRTRRVRTDRLYPKDDSPAPVVSFNFLD